MAAFIHTDTSHKHTQAYIELMCGRDLIGYLPVSFQACIIYSKPFQQR